MATDGTPPGAAASPRGARAFPLVAGVLLLIQAFICFQGLGDQWTRGHNGFNGAAYHLAARNSVRWGDLFPVQYLTGRTPPTPADYYTHHPLAMHLHNVASLSLFGDTEASIRLVPAVHSILALVALLLFVRRFWGPATAMVAGAIYVALPTNGIYANMMNHPAGCIFWCILAFWCYLRFREERDCDRGDGAGAPPRVGVGAAQRDRACTGGAPARWGRFYAGMLGAFVMATSWEWPAYYAAFFIGLHWLVVAIARRVRDPGPGAWRRLFGEFALLAGFGVWILVQFVGFFLLVRLLVGNLHELTGTISSRQAIGWGRFAYTLRVVPALMFTWPVLAICAFWLARTLVRLVRGRFEHRDLVPLSFAIGGWVHYFVFKWSTIVHEYWLWTTLPFAAIACATVLAGAQRFVRDRLAPPALRLVCDRLAPAALRLVRDRLAPPALRLVRDRLAPAALRLVRDRLAPPALRVVRDRQAPPALRVVRSEAWRARVATAAGLAVWLVLVPLAVRAVDLVPRGRAVGGSMWFTERTRPDPISRYDSGRTELRFADRVRRWTDRDTGVLVHDSIGRTVPECRFDTTLDREMRWVRGTRPADLAGPPAVGVTGWVFIAPVGSLPPTIRAELASRHPWRQLGDHVMVDLRSDRPEIEVWRLDEQPFDLWWWFWRSAFEPEVLPVRDPAAEEALSRAVERARTGR